MLCQLWPFQQNVYKNVYVFLYGGNCEKVIIGDSTRRETSELLANELPFIL